MSSDSDEDWFNKDLDKFVVDVQDKIENISLNQENNNVGGPSNVYFDSEYGGNYNKPALKSNQNNAKSKNSNDVDNDLKKSQLHIQYIQPISYKKLHFILELTPLNIFIEIMQPDSGFSETLNRSTITIEMFDLILKTISAILLMPFYEFKKSFLKMIIDSENFWSQLEVYLKNMYIEMKATKKNVQKKVQIDDRQLWENLIQLCKNIDMFFESNTNFIKICLDICKQQQSQKQSFVKWFKEFEQLSNVSDVSDVNDDNVDNNIKSKDIYPSLKELKTPKTIYLKPNIIKGRYSNVEHYLDIHMSLLREDFISPLRDGILQFITESKTNDIKNLHNIYITIYPKVRILKKQNKLLLPRNNKCEYLMVDVGPDSRRLQSDSNDTVFNFSKKLMFGSLLLFTSNQNVDDLILAVISNRDVELLVKGYIQIEIIKTYNISLIFDRDFIMFESDIYFEPYHHVFKVLRNLNEEQFPMRNFVIEIDKSNIYPNYIPPIGKTIYVHKKCSLDLKNFSTWPTSKMLKLDDSQMNAFKNSLTHKFSLIQGPPGTGKTFVGLEILSALLKNTDEQILIICLTNHALDQFLTGSLQYTEDIVRMGNQSKSDLLDKYNVKQLSENLVTDKRLKNCFYQLKCQYNELMQKFEDFQFKIDIKRNDEKNEEKTKDDDDLIMTEKLMLDYQNQFRSISRKQEELKQIAEYNMLKSKRIIGMTSSYAAKCNLLIKLLKTPIVFIEEAAELLESHIIATITNDTQHLILIGDHHQLRPTTSVYKLSKLYKMDISLFERMINNNINCITLTTQHRMRTEIANLIRPIIYKELFDNDTVKNYPNIMGVKKNLFFINHSELENIEDMDETSKKNVFEAQYLVAFCNYLILQGYAPDEITILTTYNGQLMQFSQERKKFSNLRKVRIAVVDNYQGEENRIILLSLVRSNRNDKIGYLAMQNRICVALTRAREGLFIIGNMDLLSKNSTVWNDIRMELIKQNAIDNVLSLQCQRHQNITLIKEASDFELVKYGGCTDNCNVLLNCGHQCNFNACHTNKFEHYSECNCFNKTYKN